MVLWLVRTHEARTFRIVAEPPAVDLFQLKFLGPFLAPVVGIEPTLKVLETLVLPLYDTDIKLFLMHTNIKFIVYFISNFIDCIEHAAPRCIIDLFLMLFIQRGRLCGECEIRTHGRFSPSLI